MSSHATPRWANWLFGLAAPLIVGAVLMNACLRGFDLTETLGFLWMNLGWMFGAWLVFGLFLNGVVTAITLLSGRRQIARLTPTTARVVRNLVVGLIGCAVACAVALWQPFGRGWSIGLGLVIMFGSFILAIRLQRGMTDQDMIKAQDEILTVNDDEDHKWYGIR